MTEQALRLPYANRALEGYILAVADVIRANPEYWNLSRRAFVIKVQIAGGGRINPVVAGQLYDELMQDVGLEPLP